MAARTKTNPPTASDVPKKERRLTAGFGDLGLDVDVRNNDAETFLIMFMVWRIAAVLNNVGVN
jgi:hypothetical protein